MLTISTILVPPNKIHEDPLKFDLKSTRITAYPDFDTFIGFTRFTLDLYETSTRKWKNLYTPQDEDARITLCVADGDDFFFLVTTKGELSFDLRSELFQGNLDGIKSIYSMKSSFLPTNAISSLFLQIMSF